MEEKGNYFLYNTYQMVKKKKKNFQIKLRGE
jgi:hypothetical protein